MKEKSFSSSAISRDVNAVAAALVFCVKVKITSSLSNIMKKFVS